MVADPADPLKAVNRQPTRRERQLALMRPWARAIWPLLLPITVLIFPLYIVVAACIGMREGWDDWRRELIDVYDLWRTDGR